MHLRMVRRMYLGDVDVAVDCRWDLEWVGDRVGSRGSHCMTLRRVEVDGATMGADRTRS